MKPATTFTHIVVDVAGLPQQPRMIVDACDGGAGSGASSSIASPMAYAVRGSMYGMRARN